MFESLHLHVGASLFTANSACAKHHEGLIFEGGIDFLGGLRKVAKVRNLGVEGALECTHANFVLVADIEKSEGAFFVQPLFEFLGGDFGGRVPGGVNSLDPKADDLLLDFDEHSLKRLISAKALFGANGRQAGDGADDLENGIELGNCPGEEKIDSLGSEENGAFDSMVEALCFEKGFPVLQVIQRGKLVAGEVDDFPIHE